MPKKRAKIPRASYLLFILGSFFSTVHIFIARAHSEGKSVHLKATGLIHLLPVDLPLIDSSFQSNPTRYALKNALESLLTPFEQFGHMVTISRPLR